jgi:hypothetical protein
MMRTIITITREIESIYLKYYGETVPQAAIAKIDQLTDEWVATAKHNALMAHCAEALGLTEAQ